MNVRSALLGFVAGVVGTIALGAAAQLPDGELVPKVEVFDMHTRTLITRCNVLMVMLDGHRLMCDRRRQ